MHFLIKGGPLSFIVLCSIYVASIELPKVHIVNSYKDKTHSNIQKKHSAQRKNTVQLTLSLKQKKLFITQMQDIRMKNTRRALSTSSLNSNDDEPHTNKNLGAEGGGELSVRVLPDYQKRVAQNRPIYGW